MNFESKKDNPIIVPTRTKTVVSPGGNGSFQATDIPVAPRMYNTQVFDKKAVQQPAQPVQQPVEHELTPEQVVQEEQAHHEVAQKAVTPPPYKGIPSIFNQTGKKS